MSPKRWGVEVGDLVVALFRGQTIMGRVREEVSRGLYIDSDGIAAFLDEVDFVSKADIKVGNVYYCKNGVLQVTGLSEGGEPIWRGEHVVDVEDFSEEDVEILKTIAQKLGCKLASKEEHPEKTLTLTEGITFTEEAKREGA